MGADDGLDWLLSLDVDQDDALAFLKTLDKMTESLKGTKTDLDKVEEASGHAAKGHKKHGDEAKHAEGILHHFHKAVLDPFIERLESVAEFEFIRRGVDALLEAPMEALEKLKELGEEMINVAAKTERTNRSFELLFGAAEGSEVLEYLDGIAKYTEFTDDRLKGAAQSLAKVGFAGKDLTRAIAASLDIASFSSDKEGGFSEALGALERIKRTGRVDNRVLGGLGIGESAFLKELSARTGQGTATLKKELEKGKVSAEVALETLYAMIGKKTGKALGGAGVDMGKTLEARMTHLRDLPEQFFQKLAKTEAFDHLSAAAERFLEKLDPDGPTGKKIFEGLEAGFGAISDAIDSIDVAELGEDLKELASDIKPVIEGFETFGRVAKQSVSGVKELLLSAIDVLSLGTAGSIYRGAKNRDEYLKVVGGFGREGTDNRSFKEKFIGFFKSFSEGAAAAGTMSGKGMAQGIMSSADDVANASMMMGDAASSALQSKLDIHSPSRVFANLGQMTAAGFMAGIEESAAGVDAAVGQMVAIPKARPGAGGFGGVNVGGVSVSVSVPSGSSATAEQIGEATARAVESILPGALESALATIALQGGTA